MVRHDKVNKEKKQTKSNVVIAVIIVVVLIAFVSAIFIISPGDAQANPDYKKSDYKTYNGFEFEQQGDFWLTYVELDNIPYEAPFYNHPLDIEDIAYDDSITDLVLRQGHTNIIIAVSDNVGSTPVLAGANIARITGRLYGLPTSSALYALPEARDVNQTIFNYVDCSDATNLTPIVWINPQDDNRAIYRDAENPNCIIVGGTTDEEILASSDRLAYKLLEIN